MTKLIQVCASVNDLFALDGDGVVYQYNFSTNTWMTLGRGRSDLRESSLAEGEAAQALSMPRSAAPPPERA